MKRPEDKEIIEKLEERGASMPCARCGNEAFSLVATTTLSIQDDLSELKLGGVTVPCAIIACNRCGSISLHALGALGFLAGDR